MKPHPSSRRKFEFVAFREIILFPTCELLFKAAALEAYNPTHTPTPDAQCDISLSFAGNGPSSARRWRNTTSHPSQKPLSNVRHTSKETAPDTMF